MLNYTDRLTLLMRDIVSRVPALSFIDMDDIHPFLNERLANQFGAMA